MPHGDKGHCPDTMQGEAGRPLPQARGPMSARDGGEPELRLGGEELEMAEPRPPPRPSKRSEGGEGAPRAGRGPLVGRRVPGEEGPGGRASVEGGEPKCPRFIGKQGNCWIQRGEREDVISTSVPDSPAANYFSVHCGWSAGPKGPGAGRVLSIKLSLTGKINQ